MFATIDGLAAFLGSDPDGVMGRENLEMRLNDCECRLRAYIIPNNPACEEQQQALERAVYAQLAYELSGSNEQISDMPGGITQFTVNGFSAALDKLAADGVSRVGLCPRAKAELLYAGLLFRGVKVC